MTVYAPKNRKPRYCPNCHGSMIKSGRNRYGKQMWRCRDHKCDRQTSSPKMS